MNRAGPRLDWASLEKIRCTPGASTLLFITDRCPVGCAHCSVDSRRDSPMIRDFSVFEAAVDWICDQPSIEVVGISGGEPFVERRGLTLASERIADAGKALVLYTSGMWATRPEPPAWIDDVLDRSSTVFLSTDAFHAQKVPHERYVHAARAIARAGAWIVVQVIDQDDMPEAARALLVQAFGAAFGDFAELRLTRGLTAGRGEQVFFRRADTPGRAMGACPMLRSPMVRYDGVATACCNESVIMGLGPPRLRRRATSKAEFATAMDGFRADPLLQAVEGIGLGAITLMPRFGDLADEKFASICNLCWKICSRVAEDPRPDPLLEMFAGLAPALS